MPVIRPTDSELIDFSHGPRSTPDASYFANERRDITWAPMSELNSLPNRAVVSVSGEDAETLLAGLVTNGPPAEGSCFSALLTPQGKVLFDFHIQNNVDGFWIDVDGDAANAFVKRLTLYRLRAKVEIAVNGGLSVCMDSAGERSIGAAGGAPALSTDTYHARRIAAGVPEWGADFGSDDVFPMDVNFDLLAGVDYKKGCFVGQEVASRMKRKSEARKRTLIATFEGAPPAKDTAITAGASTLGHIMSGVDGNALALVRLDRLKKAQDNNEQIIADGRDLTLSHPAYMTAE